jgi:FAD/FMN-containing dehydrogenase
MASFATTPIDELRDRFSGVLLMPGAAAYDDARVLFNAMIDRRPALIAQCASTEDVGAAIRFARDAGLEVAVRGGGHGVAGRALCDDGLVIDLRRMNGVRVDPGARVAVVGGGATMSNLDRATEPHGLATTGGRVSTTGVGGFVLGGGNGWLDRKMGLACDNLVAAEVVTADGRVLTASAEEHPELFWALHGGGGNFGVVTSMTLRLHPLGPVTVALLLWEPEEAGRVLRAYRDFVEAASDDVGGGALFLTTPPEAFVPEDMAGRLGLGILLVVAEPEVAGRATIAPMLGLGHRAEMIAEMPYAELQCMIDDPPGYRNYWSAEHLRELPDAAIDAFAASVDGMIVPSPSQHALFPEGGAVARETADWPVPWRQAPWCVHPFGLWSDRADDARGRQWSREVRAAVAPWATGAVYLNFIGDEGEDRTVAGFGAEAYRRLAGVKREYDPDNVFHLNHNIRPA